MPIAIHSKFLATLAAALLLLVPPLLAQTVEPDGSPAAASATPEHKKEDHSISIQINGGDDADADDAKSKLTPDQLFKLQLAKAEHPHTTPLGEQIGDSLVPLGFFATVVIIVLLVIRSRARQRELTHETLRLMVEKGQPVPPALFLDRKPEPKPRNDLRRGLIFCAVGLGIVAFLLVDRDSDWGLGLIPLFVGLGYLVIWKIQGPSQHEPPR